ncbi:hypothetical protein L9F63_015044, partial [Diploptera punctata]
TVPGKKTGRMDTVIYSKFASTDTFQLIHSYLPTALAGGPGKLVSLVTGFEYCFSLHLFLNVNFSQTEHWIHASMIPRMNPMSFIISIFMTDNLVPLAAPQISLKALSPTSIRVTWVPLNKEKAQGVVTEYKIQWRREHQSSTPVEHVKGDLTDYTITGLQPGRRYQVRVLAATSKGWPNQSDDFEWKDEETPNYGPQNVPQAPVVHLTVVNSTSIEVTWSNPPEDKYKPNGFKLYYRRMNSEEKFGPIDLASNITQFLLGDLDPDSCNGNADITAPQSI